MIIGSRIGGPIAVTTEAYKTKDISDKQGCGVIVASVVWERRGIINELSMCVMLR